MDSMTFRHLEELVVARTGLQVRDRDRDTFCGFVESRMKVLKLAHPEAYHQLLSSNGNGNSSEWEQLISVLANNESYFFRDSGQFSLLRYHILPELIRRNRRTCSLRLWSAGCSTGEEPYSLAILVDQLLPGRSHWDVAILGTDLDGAALQHARQGLYERWSFRATPPDIQRQYFHAHGARQEIDEQIRQMVTFRFGNLLSDPYPNKTMGICDMDLIVCRNVFIYFDRSAVADILRKLTNTLQESGYLLTGHAELHDQKLCGLQPKVFPESTILQRVQTTSPGTPSAASGQDQKVLPPSGTKTPPPSDHREKSHVVRPVDGTGLQQSSEPALPKLEARDKTETPQALELLSQAEAMVHAGSYRTAIERLTCLLERDADNHGALSLMAEAYANLGDHDAAAAWCRKAIEADSLGALPYYLLAHIAEEQGDLPQAKELLKKVVYLSPGLVMIYLELGALYERDQDLAKAQSMRDAATELLAVLPTDASVDPYGHVRAGELAQQLREGLP